jgi:2-amino-4-hydroxy-6-hydroxymethyldihydropteridine diphosphokinase
MKSVQVSAFVGIGSNLGDAQDHVRRALKQLATLARTTLTAKSSMFRTAPLDADGDDYINAVAQIDTALTAEELLHELQTLENAAGRERPYPNAPRTLDLDLLLYGRQIISGNALAVPHPRMLQRAFVLIPLLQIDPLITIPGKGPAHDFVQDVAEQKIHKIAD